MALRQPFSVYTNQEPGQLSKIGDTSLYCYKRILITKNCSGNCSTLVKSLKRCKRNSKISFPLRKNSPGLTNQQIKHMHRVPENVGRQKKSQNFVLDKKKNIWKEIQDYGVDIMNQQEKIHFLLTVVIHPIIRPNRFFSSSV